MWLNLMKRFSGPKSAKGDQTPMKTSESHTPVLKDINLEKENSCFVDLEIRNPKESKSYFYKKYNIILNTPYFYGIYMRNQLHFAL